MKKIIDYEIYEQEIIKCLKKDNPNTSEEHIKNIAKVIVKSKIEYEKLQ